jgi:hypothetical protein
MIDSAQYSRNSKTLYLSITQQTTEEIKIPSIYIEKQRNTSSKIVPAQPAQSVV